MIIRQWAADAGFRGEGLVGKRVEEGQRIVVARGALLELGDAERAWRLRLASGFDGRWGGAGQVVLEQGSMLVWSAQEQGWQVRRPRGLARLVGRGTAMVEATANGAMKVISVEGSWRVEAMEAAGQAAGRVELGGGTDRVVALREGEMVFLLPDVAGFGPRLQLDLQLLGSTSLLILGLPEALPGQRAMELAAFRQGFQIRGWSNALVGDARDGETFQVLVAPKADTGGAVVPEGPPKQ